MKENILDKVEKFHKATGAPVLSAPVIPDESRADLRVSLLEEELEELKKAITDGDIVEVLDALADLQYILAGTVLEFGMKDIFQEAFNEVQRSNMSKFCEVTSDARESVNKYYDKGVEAYYKKVGDLHVVYRIRDNKILKGRHFTEPKLKALLKKNGVKL
jgi:predicted HAD superfamily Cof-like phosphohydrolase